MLSSACSVTPDTYTYPFLLKACLHLSALSEGHQVHAHVLKFGLERDGHVSNSLIRLYSELGLFEHARKVFDRMPVGERSEVSLAMMVGGLVRNGRAKEAVNLFRLNDWKSLRLDQVTLATVLSACARVRDIDLGEEIHCYIEENGVGLSVILCNSLMNMYAKCGELVTAKMLFREMPEKDSVSWNALIAGLVENGYLEEGLELFSKMQSLNVRANEATLLCLVSACTGLELAKMIHGYIRKNGFESQVSICNALIDMYSRIGFVETGREIFEEMPEKDIITWNSMIAGYARCGSTEVARSLFNQMPERDNFSWSTMILGYVRNDQPKDALNLYKEFLAEVDAKPDTVTIVSALSACSHLGALEEGSSLHLYIENNGIDVTVTLGTALIDMYSKCGCIEKAKKVFREMRDQDVFSWTAMISGLALNGLGKEALQVFKEMSRAKGESAKPNPVTFLNVLWACAHSGLVEDGRRIYQDMIRDYRIKPEMAHLGCMVDLLARAGHLDEALDFISSCGCQVDASAWGALLGACRVHGNVKLGEIVARKMVELDPGHGGAHVLMSNIYAEAEQWAEKKELRRKMKDENITKEIATSWIEVDGLLHEFGAGDIWYDTDKFGNF